MLEKLYALREEFYEALKNQPAGAEDTTKLQDQLRRAEYRIAHLRLAIDQLVASEV